MKKYPYYESYLKSWIYDKVPDSMVLATDEKVLKLGTKILFKPTDGSLKDCFVSAVISNTNIDAAKHYLKMGLVYIKKTGV